MGDRDHDARGTFCRAELETRRPEGASGFYVALFGLALLRVVVPPTDVPSGRMSVALDPQGAAFALFANLDP